MSTLTDCQALEDVDIDWELIQDVNLLGSIFCSFDGLASLVSSTFGSFTSFICDTFSSFTGFIDSTLSSIFGTINGIFGIFGHSAFCIFDSFSSLVRRGILCGVLGAFDSFSSLVWRSVLCGILGAFGSFSSLFGCITCCSLRIIRSALRGSSGITLGGFVDTFLRSTSSFAS